MIEIDNPKDCTGCGACYSICPVKCITMHKDNEGFLYPAVKKNECINCGLCSRICPVDNKMGLANNTSAYACINKDESVRIESSSGGIFTMLAEKVIEKGGVVFGAGFNKKFKVEHIYVDNKEELYKLRGSKYVQSAIGDAYIKVKEFLDIGKRVLFSGTPCQIGGLKAYLRKYEERLICIDMVCHGVPSPLVWETYINYREAEAGALTNHVNFRQKDKGWKASSVKFKFNNGTEYSLIQSKDLYMRAFLSDICLRPSCYSCKFKSINRNSDITLADFWGVQYILPEMDDDKGTSLILVNSQKGSELFKTLENGILYKEIEISKAIKYNSATIKSAQYNNKRKPFLDELGQRPFEKLVRKYCTDSLITKIIRKIKTIIKKQSFFKQHSALKKRCK